MVRRKGPIEIEGLKELNRAISRAADRNLARRMGQANKEIGRLVLSKLDPPPDPAAVGTGAGATPRASATRREVVIRAGGKHRAVAADGSPIPARYVRMRVWGRKRTRDLGKSAPPRPYIQETARRHEDEIGRKWLEAVSEAMSPAFHDTEP